MTRIDAARIGGAGFLLGGYAMIAIAGSITSLAHFREFRASLDAENAWQATPEFPDLGAKAQALTDSDEAFRAALVNEGCVAFPALCIDAPGIDRDAIHVQTVGTRESILCAQSGAATAFARQ